MTMYLCMSVANVSFLAIAVRPLTMLAVKCKGKSESYLKGQVVPFRGDTYPEPPA